MALTYVDDMLLFQSLDEKKVVFSKQIKNKKRLVRSIDQSMIKIVHEIIKG